MINIDKVSEWVRKAVADVAAFGGKKRKVDTEDEKAALSYILAGCSKQEDRDFIQDYINGKKLSIAESNHDINENREVYTEAYQVEGGEHSNVMVFDEKGKLTRIIAKNSAGEVVDIRNFEYDGDLIRGNSEIFNYEYVINYKTCETISQIERDEKGNIVYQYEKTPNGGHAVRRDSMGEDHSYFNSNGEPEGRVIKDAAGNTLQESIFVRNKDGFLEERVIYRANSNTTNENNTPINTDNNE